MTEKKATTKGFEPSIFRSEVGRLIHQATRLVTWTQRSSFQKHLNNNYSFDKKIIKSINAYVYETIRKINCQWYSSILLLTCLRLTCLTTTIFLHISVMKPTETNWNTITIIALPLINSAAALPIRWQNFNGRRILCSLRKAAIDSKIEIPQLDFFLKPDSKKQLAWLLVMKCVQTIK